MKTHNDGQIDGLKRVPVEILVKPPYRYMPPVDLLDGEILGWEVDPEDATSGTTPSGGSGPTLAQFNQLDVFVTSLATAIQEIPVGSSTGGITGTSLTAQQIFDLEYYERKTFN